jgi:hypothetical protein
MCWWEWKYAPGDADRQSLGAVVLCPESIGRQSSRDIPKLEKLMKRAVRGTSKMAGRVEE